MLDFLVVGAQKAGTTALQWALAESEYFRVPKGKELPIFNRRQPATEIERALAQLFTSDRDRTWSVSPYVGKVTPHYLASCVAPANIATVAPRASLVAILRDPWERAFSHYRMAVARGLERRSFLHAMAEEARTLQARGLKMSEFAGYADTNYLAGSLYGALLTRYSEAGLHERITVLDYRTMRTDWDAFAAAFCRAVDPAMDPHTLPPPPPPRNVTDDGTKLNDLSVRLAAIPGIRRAAQVVPRSFRHALWWRLNEMPTRRSATQVAPLGAPPRLNASGLVLALLEDDAERLQRLRPRGTDILLPWASETPS